VQPALPGAARARTGLSKQMSIRSSAPAVALAADASFELPLAVTLRSISDAQRGAGARIFVLHGEIPQEMVERLSAVVEPPSAIEWRRVDPALLRGLRPAAHLPSPSLYSLVCAELLPPDLDRLLFLDADIVVQESLRELWEVDLEGCVIGAVRNAYQPWIAAVTLASEDAAGEEVWLPLPWRALALPPRAPYFNAGVLVIDVPLWRQVRILDQALAIQRDHGLRLGEQAALNLVLLGRWKRLHPRWNVNSGHLEENAIVWAAEDTEELRAALERPAIIHYNGPTKPWHAGSAHPLRGVWHEVLSRTPYRGRLPAEADRAPAS
jgi:lipopolysaccharide biosynthesis glycosyltransferase